MNSIFSVLCFTFTGLLFTQSSSAQNLEWAKSIVTTGSPLAIAVDQWDNLFLTGQIGNNADFDPDTGVATFPYMGGVTDIFLAKYDGLGNYIWAFTLGSGDWDSSNGVVVDDSGNVYISGYFRNTVDFDPGFGTASLVSAALSDIFLAKYDSSGNYIWAHRIGGSDHDLTNSMAIDAFGNVFITGYFSNTVDFDPGAGIANADTAGGTEIFLAKYDRNGNHLWSHGLGSPSNDFGHKVTVDNIGNVYITGQFADTADFEPGPAVNNLISNGLSDVYCAKYDSNGNYIWAFGVGGAGFDGGGGITVDSLFNTYLTGYIYDSADFDPGMGIAMIGYWGQSDFFVAKYDSNGSYLWAKGIGGISFDRAFGIGLSSSGGVYLTGSFSDTVDFDPGPGVDILLSTGVKDIFYTKYDYDGNYIWSHAIGSSGSDVGLGVIAGTADHIYLAGYYGGMADFDPGPSVYNLPYFSGKDVFFAKYSLSCATTASFTATSNTVCQGDTVVFTNTGTGGSNYEWSVDSVLFSSTQSTSIVFTDAGSSIIKLVMSDSSCIDSMSIVITVDSTYSTTIVDISICDNDSAMIFGTYQTTGGSYYDSLGSANGCDSIISVTLIVNPLTSVSFTGLDTGYCVNDGAVTLLGTPSGGMFSGAGVTNDQFDPNIAGSGTHTIIYSYADGNGCTNSLSQDVTVDNCTGIRGYDYINNVFIYPNPSTGKFNIEIGITRTENVELRITNNLGQEVFKKVLKLNPGIYKRQFNVTKYPVGIYNLQLSSGQRVITRKLMIE